MKRRLEFIDTKEGLFRGFGALWPIVAWNSDARAWVVIDDTAQRPIGWGELVTLREAERLFPGSGDAALPADIPLEWDMTGEEAMRYVPELFDGYDGPMRRLSPEEDAERQASWAADFARAQRRRPTRPPRGATRKDSSG